ncbi:MAG: hypothetical protein U0V87_00830 [Acidobacteriota bacterium]
MWLDKDNECRASLMIDQDGEDLLNGTITPERMMKWKARANGAALGLLIAFGFEALSQTTLLRLRLRA